MAKSYEELVAEARAETEQVSAGQVREEADSGDVTILDVREPGEWEAGHIPGAKHIPRGVLEYQAATELPDRDARIITHCASGGRGSLAAKTLGVMGYTNAANMEGGMSAWREMGYDAE